MSSIYNIILFKNETLRLFLLKKNKYARKLFCCHSCDCFRMKYK